jgi:hypothetical protein
MVDKKRTVVAIGFILVLSHVLLTSFSSQPPGGKTGAPDEGICTDCHTTATVNDGVGQLLLSSSEGGFYESNKTYEMTLYMERQNCQGFGFTICALDSFLNDVGEFQVLDSVATYYENFGRRYISHKSATSEENLSNGSVSRNFEWVSPDTSTGPIIFYYASHMVDTGLSLTIDHHIYNDSLILYPKVSIDINSKVKELKVINEINVYPNPAINEAVLKLGTDEIVDVKLLDLNGKTIRMYNGIKSSLVIKRNNLVEGIYFLEVKHRKGSLQLVKLVFH